MGSCDFASRQEAESVGRSPVYAEIAEQIRNTVGAYGHGVEIPSVRSLARQYGVACNTIRRALDLLVNQGLILPRGSGRRLVRYRPSDRQVFCRPYPSIALLSSVPLRFVGTGYTEILLSAFLNVAARRVPVVMSQLSDAIAMEPISGGVAIGASGTRCSAVAFLSGAPEPLQAELIRYGAIVLILDSVSKVPGVDSISVDCERDGEQAVRYLAGLGHRHFAYIADRYPHPPPHWPNGIDPDSERFSKAMLRAKAQQGLPDSPDYHTICDYDVAHSTASVATAIGRLWRLTPQPTGIVCFSTTLASDVVMTLRNRRLKCPEDVSILARGALGAHSNGYSLLGSDAMRLGQSAAEHVLNRLTRASAGPAHLSIPSVLIEGQTTAPPRARSSTP